MVYTEIIDIEKAQEFMGVFMKKIQEPELRPLLTKVEIQYKDFIHGLIITAVETGLLTNNSPERLEELRSKLIVAFDSGFILGRQSK